MTAIIMADIVSKEKTTQHLYFADKEVGTMKDVSMPRTFLLKNRHYSTTAEDIS